MTWTDVEPCGDPECDGLAEPEQDGSYRYFVCGTCGFCDCYEPVPAPQSACALGVPATIRAAFPGPPQPLPLLQIGRRRDEPA